MFTSCVNVAGNAACEKMNAIDRMLQRGPLAPRADSVFGSGSDRIRSRSERTTLRATRFSESARRLRRMFADRRDHRFAVGRHHGVSNSPTSAEPRPSMMSRKALVCRKSIPSSGSGRETRCDLGMSNRGNFATRICDSDRFPVRASMMATSNPPKSQSIPSHFNAFGTTPDSS